MSESPFETPFLRDPGTSGVSETSDVELFEISGMFTEKVSSSFRHKTRTEVLT